MAVGGKCDAVDHLRVDLTKEIEPQGRVDGWTAKNNGWKLPDSPAGYAFLSYESEPLPTKHLSAAQVLKFRDDAWRAYFTSPRYLASVEKTFGTQQRKNVEAMAGIRLKRKLLGD